MNVYLDIDSRGAAMPLLDEERMVEACRAVLVHEGVEQDCTVSISFVDDEEMRALNQEWRGVDRATDVLSFELESPFDSDISTQGEITLGDIVLSSSYVSNQAVRFGTSAADECRLLLVHAMFHLLGYDHEETQEATMMQRAEDEVLKTLSSDGTLSQHVLALHREEETE